MCRPEAMLGSADGCLSYRKGLHVFSISFKDKHGKEHEIIIGPENPEDAVKDRRVSFSYLASLRLDNSCHILSR